MQKAPEVKNNPPKLYISDLRYFTFRSVFKATDIKENKAQGYAVYMSNLQTPATLLFLL